MQRRVASRSLGTKDWYWYLLLQPDLKKLLLFVLSSHAQTQQKGVKSDPLEQQQRVSGHVDAADAQKNKSGRCIRAYLDNSELLIVSLDATRPRSASAESLGMPRKNRFASLGLADYCEDLAARGLQEPFHKQKGERDNVHGARTGRETARTRSNKCLGCVSSTIELFGVAAANVTNVGLICELGTSSPRL